jgi:hypothetical protein
MAIQIGHPLFLIVAQKSRWSLVSRGVIIFLPPLGTPGAPGTGGGACSSMGPGWESAKNQLRGLASNSK